MRERPTGLEPHVTDAQAGLGQTGRPAARDGRASSRGGAPIWCAHAEGFGLMPSPCSCKDAGRRQCLRHASLDYMSDVQADPDGFAVFGRFPKGFLRHILKLQLLGDVRRDEVLHVCSGTLTERWTVDLRVEARPRVQADGKALPFRNANFKAVLIDPPYSDAYARNLYGTAMPRNSWLLREAARVVVPGGRIGLLHVGLPFAPPWCRLVRAYPVSTGVGFRWRGLTIYERAQPGLGW